MNPTGGGVFVTGGFGFLGSALVARLLRGNRVTVFDNGRRRSPRFDTVAGHPDLTIVDGDVLDPEGVARAMGASQVIVHLAAVAGVSSYYDLPLETMKVNLLGTSHVLDGALRAGERLERFLYVSTSEVFGPFAWRVGEGDMTQQGDPADPRWTYAIAKLAAEKLALCYHWEHSLPVVVVRPFNVYGPGQVGEGAVHAFVRCAVTNAPLLVTGDGAQIRSWCYVDDAVAGLEAALLSDRAVGRVYNLGNPGTATSIAELARRIRTLAGSRSPIHYVPHRGADVQVRVPDITRARAELGFDPQVGLDDGLVRTLDWYRSVLSTTEHA